jgi:acetyl-CoA acetyltransferase
MGIGPAPASRKLLDRIGWTIDSLDVIELNEAFASQALACMRELRLEPGIVNNSGGAIALGHPLGSSGSRLVITLLGRLEREATERRKLGLATMCVGVGQGTALLLEGLS